MVDSAGVDVNAIASAVWDKLLADHTIDGSAGKALSTASSGGVDYGALADAVWDEPLTGATHNIPTSAGRRLRQISAPIILEGFIVSSTVNTVTFDGGASTFDGAYDPCIIAIVDGTGAGQSRLILEYTGATKTAIIDRNWKVLPNATSEYIITSSEGREHVNEGKAQSGTINTITLNVNASSFDNAYKGQVIFIRSGTGEDQARRVLSYNGTTKIAIPEKPWFVSPDGTSGYVMLPTSILSSDGIADAVWDTPQADHAVAGSFGKTMTDSSDNIDTLLNMQAGNWEIKNNQMLFYDLSGILMFSYNLFDSAGIASMSEVFKRVKV
jgi:hypothetical protein